MKMQLTISGKNMDTGPAFQEHAQAQLEAAIEKYFPRAVSGSVTLEKDTAGFAVKVHVNLATGMDMEANGKAGDAHQALDVAADHIEKRLRRYKRRLRNHRHDQHETDQMDATMTVLSLADFKGEADDNDNADDMVSDDGAPAILAEMDYPINIMSLEEAIMRFDISGQPAMMFRNRSHMGLNMIYRRNDGSIGWVDPRGNR
jgi:ribosomal subunit interface protein